MSFELKKDPTRWIVAGTGSGIELCPKRSNATIIALNDLLYQERYGIDYDILCIMDLLHEKPQVLSNQTPLGDVMERINKGGKPLLAPYRYAEIPKSLAFPLKACVKAFGAPYFSNTICYMIAYALLNGARIIDTYGINQASQSEYGHEKAATEYWLGIANGLGVKITIHGANSELLTTKTRYGGGILYGYNSTHRNIEKDQETYGEAVIHKLTAPLKSVSRTVRGIN